MIPFTTGKFGRGGAFRWLRPVSVLTWADIATAFETAANWAGFRAPVSNTWQDTVQLVTTTNVPSIATDCSLAGIRFEESGSAGGLTLTSAGGVTMLLGRGGIQAPNQLSGTTALSVANIVLAAPQTWTLFNALTSVATTSNFNISSNIDTNGQALTIACNRHANTGNIGNLTFSGVISGVPPTFNGNSAFRNFVSLSGLNTWTGTCYMRSAQYNINSLASGGGACSLGSSGDIVINNSSSGFVMTFNGLSANGTFDRRIYTTGTASSTLVQNDPTYTISLNSSANWVDPTDTGNNIISLSGSNAGDNTFAQVINNRTGFVTTVGKASTGTWVLTAANTYTGVTTINLGTLKVSSINDGGAAGNLGAASNAASNLVINNAGTLTYRGSGESTDRLFTISHNTGSANMTVNSSGSGPINFTNTGAIAHASVINMSRTLTLSGTNTGNNTLAPILTNNGTGVLNVTKSGTGTWVLAGANTYTGWTTVSDGKLKVAAGGSLGGASSTLSIGQGHLDLGATSQTVGSFSMQAAAGGPFIVSNGTLTPSQFTMNNVAAYEVSAVIAGSCYLAKSGTGTLKLSGANTYTGYTVINNDSAVTEVTSLKNGGVASSLGASTNVADNLVLGNSSTLRYVGGGDSTDRLFKIVGTVYVQSNGTGPLAFTNTGIIGIPNAQNTSFYLQGTNTGDNTFACALVDPVGGIPLSVFKGGVGTWVLTNTNTYTGQTLILDGILRLTGALTNSTVVSSGGTLQGPATTGASCTVSGPVQISATAGVTSTFQPGTFGNNTFNTGALSFGGTLARATFNSTTNTFSKINVTGTCALGGMGCIFPAGITTNGTYDLIVASGTMSGTLPSIITNLTGKTLSLSKVGNTLKVTVS